MRKDLFLTGIISLFQAHKNPPSKFILENGISKFVNINNNNDINISNIIESRCDVTLDNVQYEICEHFSSIFSDMRCMCGDDELFKEAFSEGSSFTYFKSNSLGSRNNKVEFYWSKDKHFMIKSLSSFEYDQLSKILYKYHKHIKKYPNTMLSKFYGLYSFELKSNLNLTNTTSMNKMIKFAMLKTATNNNNDDNNNQSIFVTEEKKKKNDKYYIVMKNVFNPRVDMERTYDLKGSMIGRKTKTPLKHQVNHESSISHVSCVDINKHNISYNVSYNKLQSINKLNTTNATFEVLPPPPPLLVLKDLNFIELNQSIELIEKNAFIKQLIIDVMFLNDISVMDYSLLIGISKPSPHYTDQNLLNKLSTSSNVSNVSNSKDKINENDQNLLYKTTKSLFPFRNCFRRSMNKNELMNQSVDELKYSNVSKFDVNHDPYDINYEYWESVVGKDIEANRTTIKYYISIIDFLQPYSPKKWAETLMKSLLYKPNQCSSVDPYSYAKRFVKFIVSKVLK